MESSSSPTYRWTKSFWPRMISFTSIGTLKAYLLPPHRCISNRSSILAMFTPILNFALVALSVANVALALPGVQTDPSHPTCSTSQQQCCRRSTTITDANRQSIIDTCKQAGTTLSPKEIDTLKNGVKVGLDCTPILASQCTEKPMCCQGANKGVIVISCNQL
ncbi:hypothetical protein PM082_021369 [Marasmius tenuissimus]|nr:hypothetical protein PM082_021369 [Marasmius tenuissimus]